ncbi:MAG TPA: oxidoreductase [Bacteroidia bacterium]|jgi:NAD(P)-dependent dehydrogenase (short-subunit alcohol dehydrogenase family)|nr:oxidoreductase [Bacteroidia bacterium]
MSNELTGKVVVVTGGAGLLGRSFCEAICGAGGTVIVAEKVEKEGKKLAEELQKKFDGRALYIGVDITSEASLQVLIESVHSEFGYIDALVNAAYPRNKNYGKRFEEVTYHDFVENVGMHAGGYFLAAKQFLHYFSERKQGNIINLASIYGIVPPRFEIYEGTDMTMPIEYAVIKAGIIHLTKYITRYYKGKGIRCNCISPGGIFNKHPESFVDQYRVYSNTKGMMEPKDISGALVFLLSDASAMVNGQNLVVDDGWSL